MTQDQITILKHCVDQASGSIPIQIVKGQRYLFTSIEGRPELDSDNATVKELFDNGYLEYTSESTCKLTALGIQVASAL
jgi:hypothetical protein